MILSTIHPPSRELLNIAHEVRCEAFMCYIAATIQMIGNTASTCRVIQYSQQPQKPTSDKEEMFKGVTNSKP